jgi:hypothetical protein
MRATFNGQPGELTIEHCTVLRYMENGKVRKFYQQMLVAFGPDGLPAIFWSISNWGPGPEAAWTNSGDLKGGLKSESQPSSYMAESANTRQVNSKINGGYLFHTEFRAAANVKPPPKLLAELGVRTHDLLRDIPSKPPTPAANARWQSLLDMRATVNDLSAIAMHSLMVGDLSAAIAERQDLIDLMLEIRTLHESTQGQLEMLSLKLAAELRK